MLAAFGAHIDFDAAEDGARIVRVEGIANLKAQAITVPGDPSSAAFPIVAALIVEGSDVTVENVLLNPTRIGLVLTLQEMGGDVTIANRRMVGGEKWRHPRQGQPPPRRHCAGARAPSMIDEYPVLAIAAAVAEGDTLMEGLARCG